MTKVSLSGEHRTVEWVWDWYLYQERLQAPARLALLDALAAGGAPADLSRRFRGLFKEKGPRVELDDDILEGWKLHHEAIVNRPVGEFRGALKLRHWLAHGRYWTRKIGREYSPEDVFGICMNLLDATGLNSASES